MRNFRPHAPVVPRLPGSLTDVADDEVRRAVETSSKVDILNGRTTEWIELGPKGFGTPQKVAHKLGRVPIGWFVASYMGFPPKYRVDEYDAKHITVTSLDQVDVCGKFSTDGAGAVTTGARYLWSASRQGVGIYRVALSFDCVALMSAEAKSTTLSGATEVRYTGSSFAGPIYVDFTNYSIGAPADLLSLDVLLHIAVTGSDSRMKLWVY